VLETTSTETVVSMVEAGLGVAIVPLMPTGAVTRGRRVSVQVVEDPMRPIRSGILLRRGEKPAGPAARLIEYLKR
jgi:DNA-binding transcriptional LysR family regulator